MKSVDLARALKKMPMSREDIGQFYSLERDTVNRLLSTVRNSPRFVLVEKDGVFRVKSIKKKKRGMPITIYPRDIHVKKMNYDQRTTKAKKYALPLPMPKQ